MICPRSYYNKIQNNKNLGILREPHVNKMNYSLMVRREKQEDQDRNCLS